MLIITITWATSIFGDGYIELSRHLHLAIVYSAITWLLIWFVVVLRLKSASMLILSGAITYGVAHAMYRLPVGTFLLLQVDKNSEFMLLDGQAMDNVAITRIDFESKDGNRITEMDPENWTRS